MNVEQISFLYHTLDSGEVLDSDRTVQQGYTVEVTTKQDDWYFLGEGDELHLIPVCGMVKLVIENMDKKWPWSKPIFSTETVFLPAEEISNITFTEWNK